MRLITDVDGYVTQSFEHGSDQSLDEASGNVLKKIIEEAEKDKRQGSTRSSAAMTSWSGSDSLTQEPRSCFTARPR
jgi:hypothetical protein